MSIQSQEIHPGSGGLHTFNEIVNCSKPMWVPILP